MDYYFINGGIEIYVNIFKFIRFRRRNIEHLEKQKTVKMKILISVMEQQNFCQRPENGSGINGVQE